jgi:hypothetical protein
MPGVPVVSRTLVSRILRPACLAALIVVGPALAGAPPAVAATGVMPAGSAVGAPRITGPRAAGFGVGVPVRTARLERGPRVVVVTPRRVERTLIVRREVPTVIGIARMAPAQPVIYEIVPERRAAAPYRGRDRARLAEAAALQPRIIQVRVRR